MQNKLNKDLHILIAGPLPPPIGGVTIHVQRLLHHLKQHQIPHSHIGRSILQLVSALIKPSKANIVHIHYSNALVRWASVLLFKFKGFQIITTIHRDLNRDSGILKLMTVSSIKNSDRTIVLNDESLQTAKTIADHCIKHSSFIPPVNPLELNTKIQSSINSFKQNKTKVFCTNAFDLAYDKSGDEIYQISNLVKIFSELPDDYGLIVSDPSGHNLVYTNGKMSIPNNVLFIAEPHHFIPVLKEATCFIRATTTDGDSLSIKEALDVGTNVIASNCVERHPSCALYQSGNNSDLKEAIVNFRPCPITSPINAFNGLLQIYKAVLNKPIAT